MTAESAYGELTDCLRRTAILLSCRRLLGWDRDTHMPRGGAELRADQTALLMGLLHRRRTAPELGALLEKAAPLADGADPDAPVAANLREARRDFDRATRIPAELIEERARTFTLAHEAWVDARARDDFAAFLPWLERNITLTRRYAEALGHEGQLYDALLDEYEPGETTAHVGAFFAPLREALVDLLCRIRDAGEIATDVLRGSFPAAAQASFATRVATELGFDFERGRLELEQALLRGDVAAQDLPGAWSERFAASFGVRPPDDRQGCLQDVHWGSGLFGYFPTYTLGNIYAAQLFAQAQAELGDLDASFARGEFAPLLRWFRERVHAHGRRYRPRRLIERVTGAPPSHEPLVRHLETRYAAIYGITCA